MPILFHMTTEWKSWRACLSRHGRGHTDHSVYRLRQSIKGRGPHFWVLPGPWVGFHTGEEREATQEIAWIENTRLSAPSFCSLLCPSSLSHSMASLPQFLGFQQMSCAIRWLLMQCPNFPHLPRVSAKLKTQLESWDLSFWVTEASGEKIPELNSASSCWRPRNNTAWVAA